MSNYILGISFGFHNSAASLIKDGVLVGATEEERFTRIKHDSSFPHKSIQWLCESNGITLDDITDVSYYEEPQIKWNRIYRTVQSTFRKDYKSSFQTLYKNYSHESYVRHIIKTYIGHHVNIHTVLHHDSHSTYSYFNSPFDVSAYLSVDGVGEWETINLGLWEHGKKTTLWSEYYPNSLGLVYSAITSFLGFKPNDGEYKVMGLASYGDYRTYEDQFRSFIKFNSTLEINQLYFSYQHSNDVMFNKNLSKLFGIPNRLPEEPITQSHKDIAAGLQWSYERMIIDIINDKLGDVDTNNLVLGGGSSYNCVANSLIPSKTKFENVWVPPNPSDGGSSIGAAANISHIVFENLDRQSLQSPFQGPEYNHEYLTKFVEDVVHKTDGVSVDYLSTDDLLDLVSYLIKNDKVIGWFEGKSEFGARALGNRSILANPTSPTMKERLNKVVKRRESFRPFAPIVQYDKQQDYFNSDIYSPFMSFVVSVKDEYLEKLPAITHVNNTARIQSLKQEDQPRIYDLLTRLNHSIGYPIVLNTSFNVKDQPIVQTPRDAFDTFISTDIDYMVLGNYILFK